MKVEELVVGGTYFLVTFYDEDLLIPEIKTYIFIGANCLESTISTGFFQSASEYFERGKWCSGLDATDYGVLCVLDDCLSEVFDCSGLQYQLELIKNGGAFYYE
jgi:hypothetical protein